MNSVTVSSVMETDRLVLREHTIQDAQAILEIFGDTEVMRHFGMKPVSSLDDAIKMVNYFERNRKENGLNRWAVALKKNRHVVGSIFYTNIEKPYSRAEIGFLLNRSYWGKGIMHEAAEKIISFGFEHMSLNRIQALVSVDNRRSISLVKRLGFRKEGILREHNFNYVENRFADMYAFALLVKEHGIQREDSNTLLER
ncbi:MAG: GNAT family N-acetyltransferase [Candidatus Sabulitectum sp.]|nr:GNAT family N-acetyltransferase [Candidatus Sabulitectum sp.]